MSRTGPRIRPFLAVVLAVAVPSLALVGAVHATAPPSSDEAPVVAVADLATTPAAGAAEVPPMPEESGLCASPQEAVDLGLSPILARCDQGEYCAVPQDCKCFGHICACLDNTCSCAVP